MAETPIFIIGEHEELTTDGLLDYINTFQQTFVPHFGELKDAYMTQYPIIMKLKSEDGKPDNRLAVNFAKYTVDTFEGFFIGKTVKTTSDDPDVASYLELLNRYNDQDDNNAELSKLCSIFGRAYEVYFVDDNGEIAITYESPLNAFMIYDDSILERPRYFVRMYTDSDGYTCGALYTETVVSDFSMADGYPDFYEERPHGFQGVPATEYLQNGERVGIFEPVMSLINAYNKAISEKANDVDYFADAYLKILGAKLSPEELTAVRRSRVINFEGEGTNDLVVDFLQKPDADATQEHLLDKLEDLIFKITMVADIGDEAFGASSGIALRYKLLGMSNLAKTKERKFTSGMNRRYKLIFSNPTSGMDPEAWMSVRYHFAFNYPADIESEAAVAAQLSGIVSKETQLSTLSIVSNVKEEMKRLDKDDDPLNYGTDYATNRTVRKEDEDHGNESTNFGETD